MCYYCDMKKILLKNGELVTNEGVLERDLLIEGGKIVGILERGVGVEEGGELEEIDCMGKVILPGLIDAHVCFPGPAQAYRGDWESESKAAVSGGVTSVFDMPNDDPWIWTVDDIEDKRKLIRDRSYVNYGLYIGFDGKNIKSMHVREISDRIFFPNKYVDEVLHNRRAVLKRYSLFSLEKDLNKICYQLFLQLLPNDECMEETKKAIRDYKDIISFTNKDLEAILKTNKRQYLPGYGKLSYMIFLKSLIDPSYFRIEEQYFRGIALNFAREIIRKDAEHRSIPVEKTSKFYNAVDNLFHYRDGEIKMKHDHSMTYRHRNKYYYPYQDFTIQEITGIVNLLYYRIIKPRIRKHIEESPNFFTDWNLALSQLTTSPVLAIDDRYKLVDKMHQNIPIALFAGDYLKYELEFFALQSVRSRLGLQIEEELTEETIKEADFKIAPVYIFAQHTSIVRQLNKAEIIEYIEKGGANELRLLYKQRILRIVSTEQLCVGIHFPQLGENAVRILRDIQTKNGYIIAIRRNAAVMTDIIGIDRFHIGKVTNEVTAQILGIPMESGYIQFVPAGVRTTLAYPTPIQTAKDFSESLKSELYLNLCKEIGEENVLKAIREDAENSGSPVNYVLENLSRDNKHGKDVDFQYVSGLHKDGNPWNGVIASTLDQTSGGKWKFAAISAKNKPVRVTTFCENFEKKRKQKVKIAWNGGYILNPELVGKLGLPESYIGSPLGMIISDNRILSTPLFNKAAILIFPDGKIKIERVNVSGGMEIKKDKVSLVFPPDGYNAHNPDEPLQYYDLISDIQEIPSENRVIVRLAGNRIKEIIRETTNINIPIVPVGLTLSIRKDLFPDVLEEIEGELEIILPGMENVEHAIEAGPMLLSKGKYCLDMNKEGWKTKNSIRTQAARLDYTDMRGPKIAVGLNNEGNLSVLTINGRIRESVGATHKDMAEILLKFGITDAMGFDPGGSSTLVVEGHTKNISPYNSSYETNIYSLLPEPRAVSNAVIGYIS